MKENEQIMTMEEDEYVKMAELDDSMWWYRALHRLVFFLLRRFLPKQGVTVLDAGCGTGGLLKFLSRQEPKLRLHGVELYGRAAQIAASRSGCPVSCGSVNQLPFEEGGFDAIVCSNVLEQKGVDPAQAVSEAFRCLRPGGVFIVSESANEWLKSYHDRRVGVARRFTKNELVSILRDTGYDILYCSYWNSLLFPLVILRRKVFSPPESGSDVKSYGRVSTVFFNAVMMMERIWLRAGWTFPCGVSIIVAGGKPYESCET
ncbi:MAG: class I SAM-dependent methyltransferase [Pontiellaceae bacterium]|jgi:SAM-dependent methyltransferase|nr:class I SAM-dependent methyltransferase [Pontiellaceae bacterium]